MKNWIILIIALLFYQNIIISQQAQLLMDINPGKESSFEFSTDRLYIEYQDKLFFVARSAEEGLELWQYDGQNVSLFMDINPGPKSSNVDNFYILNNQLVFIADDGQHGTEWWISDGTPAGTRMIVDLLEGPKGGAINCCNGESGRSIIVYNDELYFNANINSLENRLYKTDGTAEGTKELAMLNGSQRTASSFTIFKGLLYFSVWAEGFWKTDGTSEGTVMIKEKDHEGKDFYPIYIYNMGDYMIMVNGDDWDIWRSDGTTEGTTLIKELVNAKAQNNQGEFFIKYNDIALFRGADKLYKGELWRSDGTNIGTYEVINTEDDSENYPIGPKRKILFKNLVYYIGGKRETGFQIYKTDGTKNGTKEVTKLNEWVNGEVYFQSDLLATEDYLFFTGGTPFNRQLWVTDGSAKNTKEIVVNPKGYSTPERFYLFKDKLIFFANGNGVGYEPHYVDISEITLNSVDENAVDSYFVIYPTPAKNEVRILTDFEYSSVSVFSIEGTQLFYSDTTIHRDMLIVNRRISNLVS